MMSREYEPHSSENYIDEAVTTPVWHYFYPLSELYFLFLSAQFMKENSLQLLFRQWKLSVLYLTVKEFDAIIESSVRIMYQIDYN